MITEIVIVEEHKIRALIYLKQAGSSLIAFGNELNQIKASMVHGEFGKWIEANIPMKISQCQKYMAIAKSNAHPDGYLNIDTEVLLLAFEPEVREVIREELKDANRDDANEIIRALKDEMLALQKTSEEDKARIDEWRKQSIAERDAKREFEAELERVRESKTEIVYVDDSKKVSEELKAELKKTKEKLKEAQKEIIEAIKKTREDIASGKDKNINDLQARETAQMSRINYLQEELRSIESLTIAYSSHRKAQDSYKKGLTECAIALMVFDDYLPNEKQAVIWKKLLSDTQLMLNAQDLDSYQPINDYL
jgi:hypothetical protein